MDRRRFLKNAIAGIAAAGCGVLGWNYFYDQSLRQYSRELYSRKPLKVRYKGVCYGLSPSFYRPPYPGPSLDSLIQRDFQIIHDELGCNSLRIWSDQNERIITSAHMAADEGFDKIIPSPRYMDSTTEETITNLSQLTKKIGFGKFSSVVVLAVGNELTVDARGIYPGFNYWERVSQIEKRQNDKTCQKKLEGLLRDLISAARANTDLDLTYAAGSWEWMMPWDDLELDILGDNHYWYKDYGDPKDPENDYMKHIEHYRQFRKPYFITEFGSGPCVQAFDRGGWRCSGISSTYGTEDGENAQARDIETYMGMFNMAHDTGLGMDGCFMFDYYDRDSQIVDTGNPATASRPRKAFYMYKSYQRAT